MSSQPSATTPSSLYRAIWRWHFFAGLIAIPFMLLLDKGRLIGTGRPDEILTANTIRGAFEVEAAIDRHPWIAAPRFSFHLTDGKSC